MSEPQADFSMDWSNTKVHFVPWVGWVLALMCSGLAPGQSPSWKTFKDSKDGVTFRYPGTWTRVDVAGLGNSAMLTAEGDRFIAAVTWQESTGTPDAPFGQTTVFAFAILAPKTSQACKDRAYQVEDDSSPASANVQMTGGVPLAHGAAQSAGAGHSIRNDVYTTFRHGRCLGFEIIFDESFIESQGPAKRNGSVDPALILRTVRIL